VKLTRLVVAPVDVRLNSVEFVLKFIGSLSGSIPLICRINVLFILAIWSPIGLKTGGLLISRMLRFSDIVLSAPLESVAVMMIV